MENFGNPVISAENIIARKKRSKYARRPNINPKPPSKYISSSSSSLLQNYGGYRNINEIYTNDYLRLDCAAYDFPLDTEEDGLNDLGVKSDRLGNESKLKKVKLKVGGVIHTIQTKSMTEIAHSSRLSAENSAEDFQGKSSGSRLKMGEEIAGKGPQIRKSRRVPKKRTLDEEFTDEEEDDEIRYLGNLRASKAGSGYRANQEIPECPDFEYTKGYGASVLDKGSARNELTITTRKRALQNGRGASPASGPNVFFPNGLPDAPSKRQKEMLPEVEVLLRKAEATQRRRLQAEKAAKEAEAEAIRKILGQDSTRKKREEKIKRQQEELAQEKNAKATVLGPNTVRWVIGPSGTVVTFSDDLGLPNIFSSLSDSYPPPLYTAIRLFKARWCLAVLSIYNMERVPTSTREVCIVSCLNDFVLFSRI
ncbi:hypothetical protein V2J09_006366 [Rumex salicifolius]